VVNPPHAPKWDVESIHDGRRRVSPSRRGPAFRWSASAPGIAGRTCARIVEQALRLFRHVDTGALRERARGEEGLRASTVSPTSVHHDDVAVALRRASSTRGEEARCDTVVRSIFCYRS
jgi:hypothetical protein